MKIWMIDGDRMEDYILDIRSRIALAPDNEKQPLIMLDQLLELIKNDALKIDDGYHKKRFENKLFKSSGE
jgi:hypothetical protein